MVIEKKKSTLFGNMCICTLNHNIKVDLELSPNLEALCQNVIIIAVDTVLTWGVCLFVLILLPHSEPGGM